ncbi:MAG TPA: ATP-dependent zinc metalloprotease FtsH [Acidimicrobiales bacterium]|nr:ATP-dependent zinc metalloprotease FtsH [Acidimicrobiales bacterium]
MSPQRADKPASRPNAPQNGEGGGPPQPGAPTGGQSWRWLWGVLAIGIVAILLAVGTIHTSNAKTLTYTKFLQEVQSKQVSTAKISNSSGEISGNLKDGTSYQVQGPSPSLPNDVTTMRNDGVEVSFPTQGSNLLGDILPYVFIVAIGAAFIFFIGRQTRGQMSGIMSIGRSKAKTFSSDRPSTTFEDVAGYTGVKQEISEVVDFLKTPARFKEIGAKIPKGVLLVGPPGTGKTLIARAVAGEAGVPFMSVSGSDFMEMFVGVGASRVRDLFQTARKQAPAIVFVDEIDSIGRKRGAGLGGGHDEREQTLNQMLSEMDGFDTGEGVVMIAATNRPDILDPALLRPGRFDRQIVVPLPDLDERLPILQVHCKGKRMASDVDLSVVARGTPGMSGADLANLVNEAALHAVRRGSAEIAMADFETARDRVLLGQRRESMVLSEDEKERIAYHEGGHAVLAYVLEHADPVHKVTILPTGMALGVTHQLPMEERHIHPRNYIEDSLCVRMGGRCAEILVYGDLSTGAANDLVGNTELARKMVREWGMSEAIGPMAWGSQGQVFLGEDLMHTRDYSEDTSKVIDDEVERILRSEEQRAMDVLSKHRGGLNAIARALLDNEIIDGAEVARLVDEAHGSPVHGEGVKSVPHFNETAIGAPGDLSIANGAHGAAEATNGASAATANGHNAHDEPEPADGPVVVPATPAVPSATGRTPEAEAWPPPPWPPAEPGTATPEGSSGS